MNSGLCLESVGITYPAPRRDQHEINAVSQLSVEVPRGQILALLGPSGCGKSSLLRAIAGFEPLTTGAITWDGRDVANVPPHRRNFGLMFQDGVLFEHLSVDGNIGYGLRGQPAKQRHERVAELLELVGMAEFQDRPVGTLSGGQRQRIALARSLAPSPRLLLLDEPLSSLDRQLREELTMELSRLLRAANITAIYVTHDQVEAFEVADAVGVMIDGRLRQLGTRTELLQHPSDRQVADFLVSSTEQS